MATHSNILAWEILWTEEPNGLQCMGSQGVRRAEHAYSIHATALILTSSGRLKCTRSPILELDRGSLWFTRTPSSLGLGGCSTGGSGLGGDVCCSIRARLVVELAE